MWPTENKAPWTEPSNHETLFFLNKTKTKWPYFKTFASRRQSDKSAHAHRGLRFAHECLCCVCHVHGDACVRVWSLHDSQCHNRAQKRLGILTGNHSRRSCVFLRHTNQHSHKESLDWTLIKEVKEEAPRPSCPPSQISAQGFTWSHSPSRRAWAFAVAKQQRWNWLRLETTCFWGSNVCSVDI